jgi:hypothetical protein
LTLIAHGAPVDVNVVRPVPDKQKTEHMLQGSISQLLGGGVEGDMIFPKDFNPKSSARGLAIYKNMKWPNGIIPYDITDITDSSEQKMIIAAMNILMYDVGTPIPNSDQRSACVFFRPRRSNDTVYFKIQYGSGCNSHIGYMTQEQPIMTLKKNTGLLRQGCFYGETIQHELMHIMGFFHEQNRPDRDNYVKINLENVESNNVYNFDKYTWSSGTLNQNTFYDYSSIMHYKTTAFSMNGQPTMVPRQAGVTIGGAKRLSPIDIAEVRHFYDCDA